MYLTILNPVQSGARCSANIEPQSPPKILNLTAIVSAVYNRHGSQSGLSIKILSKVTPSCCVFIVDLAYTLCKT